MTHKEEKVNKQASTIRRVLIVVFMLAGTLLMPIIGFVLSGLIVFGSLMFIAMFDPWTQKRKKIFPLVGIGIVLGFYYVFSNVLLVPLPLGEIFESFN